MKIYPWPSCQLFALAISPVNKAYRVILAGYSKEKLPVVQVLFFKQTVAYPGFKLRGGGGTGLQRRLPGDWFYWSVETAAYASIAKGYGSYFAPNNPITRQELAVILVNAVGQQDVAMTNMGTKTGFTDDKSISPWA